MALVGFLGDCQHFQRLSKTMYLKALILSTAVCGLIATASAQQLIVVEGTNDRVMLVDANTGVVTNPNFIDLTTSTGSAPIGPIEAVIAPNGEVRISDQLADTIFRFPGRAFTWASPRQPSITSVGSRLPSARFGFATRGVRMGLRGKRWCNSI